MIISKNRKHEIENPQIAATFRQKIGGFNNSKQLDLFISQEPVEGYKTELELYLKNHPPFLSPHSKGNSGQ